MTWLMQEKSFIVPRKKIWIHLYSCLEVFSLNVFHFSLQKVVRTTTYQNADEDMIYICTMLISTSLLLVSSLILWRDTRSFESFTIIISGVYSYPEDDSVLDPNLGQHLAFFGIEFSSLQKG